MMVVKSYFNIIKNRHILKQADILESTGDTCFVDLDRTLSCDILSVKS